MLIEYDPRHYETVSTRHTCGYHKRNPGVPYAGCTCSGTHGLRKKTPEEIAALPDRRSGTDRRQHDHYADRIFLGPPEKIDPESLERIKRICGYHEEGT